MDENLLFRSVQQLAQATYALSEADLERDYAWLYHDDEGLRFALIGSYQELRDLAATLADDRAKHGPAITRAQRVLAQYHTAYRDLQAVLFGLPDDHAGQAPAEGEWPVRLAVAHMLNTERNFFGRIWWAVERQRAADNRPLEMPDEELLAFAGPRVSDDETLMSGPFAELMSFYDAFHARVLATFVDMADAELGAPSVWWEDAEIPAEFRLHRFDAHLRQHTIQIEKTLDAIGQSPSEARRLLRLIYAALAEAEGATLGAPEIRVGLREAIASAIAARAGEVGAIVR